MSKPWFDRLDPYIRLMARRFATYHWMAAEDLRQEVYVALWKRPDIAELDVLRQKRFCRNVLKDLLRKESKRERLLSQHVAAEFMTDRYCAPWWYVYCEELLTHLQACDWHPRTSAVFLSLWRGEDDGVPLNQQKVYTYQARRHLRRWEQGEPCAV